MRLLPLVFASLLTTLCLIHDSSTVMSGSTSNAGTSDPGRVPLMRDGTAHEWGTVSEGPEPASLDSLLDAIAAHAESYRAAIPSLTADESIVSTGPGIILRTEVHAKALFRVMHAAPDAPLVESRQVTEFDGKPVSPGKSERFPLILQGAFGDATAIYFAPQVRHCLSFTLETQPQADGAQRIDFKGRPENEKDPACSHLQGVTGGYALVEPGAGQIMHLERKVDPAVSREKHVGEFVGIDYAPLPVGTQTLWLPTRITAVQFGGKLRFVAEYAHYHRFTGTVTILPNDSAATEAPQ